MSKNEYDLLDRVSRELGLKNDAALAAHLGVAPPVISNTRRMKLPVGATMIIRIHEATGIPVAEIKSYITFGPQMVGL